jgi:hypothetical protein
MTNPEITQVLTSSLQDLKKYIANLTRKIQHIEQKLSQLKKKGLIYASEYWRKDEAGNPKYLYLLYPPTQPGERLKQIYIGEKEANINQAREGILRAKTYDDLLNQRQVLMNDLAFLAENLQKIHSSSDQTVPTPQGGINEADLMLAVQKGQVQQFSLIEVEKDTFYIVVKLNTHSQEQFLSTQKKLHEPRLFKHLGRLIEYIHFKYPAISQIKFYLKTAA